MEKEQKSKIKSRIKKSCSYLLCVICSVFCILIFSDTGSAAIISDLDVKIEGNDIYVSALIKPDSRFLNDINNGLSKELIIYIDLFRVWNIWPDEFVAGKKVLRILKSDPIKREYAASSIDGNIQIEKRFRDLESMLEWTMNIVNMKLINIKELDEGEYFVKVSVESRIRKLPPVVGYFLFFVSEKEFSISKDSQRFQINKK